MLFIDPHAVVLIASGYAEGANVDQAVQSGARGYLGKPYRIADLLQGLRKVLDSSSRCQIQA
jgi:DNA-binding NarL/FixJ family response regulator